jgi:hypothetical protein
LATTAETDKGRVEKILEIAESARGEVLSLKFTIGDLLSEVQDVAEDPIAPRDAVDGALDAAAWLNHAIENVEAELDVLIDHLLGAAETIEV